MVSRTVGLAVIAALAEQAAAFNSHRHLHAERDLADKRDVHTHYVTEHQIVTVYAGQEPAPAPVEQPAVVENAQQPYEQPHVVVTEQAPPPPAPTTLVTQVKPATPSEGSGDSGKVSEKPSNSEGSGSSSPSLSSKRGVVFENFNGKVGNNFASACEKCSWAYNWDTDPMEYSGKAVFIPTIQGFKHRDPSVWSSQIQSALSNGAPAIFSFNEPDIAEQADMSPSDAAAAHAKHLAEFQGKVPIGAPSISNGQSSERLMGLAWLKEFKSACASTDGCAYDFCNIHWYSQYEYRETLLSHLEEARDVCDGKPLWLTEFDLSGTPTEEQRQSFIEEMIPQLDKLDYLDGYSYFMADPNNGGLRTTSDGAPLGGASELYVSL